MEKLTEGWLTCIGGFMAVMELPEKLVDAVMDKGVKDLTVVCNDAGRAGVGAGQTGPAGVIQNYIALTHRALNPELGKKMSSGDDPKWNWLPQARWPKDSGRGRGRPGRLPDSPDRRWDIVEEGKQKITLDGKDYLLEKRASRGLRPSQSLAGGRESATWCSANRPANFQHRSLPWPANMWWWKRKKSSRRFTRSGHTSCIPVHLRVRDRIS
jgi:hypothetical protein